MAEGFARRTGKPLDCRGFPGPPESKRGVRTVQSSLAPPTLVCAKLFTCFLHVFIGIEHTASHQDRLQVTAAIDQYERSWTHWVSAHSDHRKSTRSSGAAATRSASPFLTTASGTGFYVVEIREEGPGKSSTHSGRILKPIGCTQCGQGTKDALLNPNGSTKGS